MPEVKVDSYGNLRLPKTFLQRRHSFPEGKYWLDERDGNLILHGEVRGLHFPSCPDCDLCETCDLRDKNEGCWGWKPSCADCLWAQDIVRCP